ncbi:MAG: hypothetical protein DI537_13900 [Stutzerimonas stutzeri]|nr:MAG: hypothetical protein DI537_13900 [Stutzerimonas stutzeri]
MSVITYRDGVMAADSRAYAGSTTPIGAKMKIHRLKDGGLFGVTSSVVGLPEAVKSWLDSGCQNDLKPECGSFDAIHVKPNGEVFFYSEGFMPSGPLIGPYFSTGSGERYALGAMSMGAGAVQAAAVAAELDPMCSGPITSMTLQQAPCPPVDS